MDNGGESREGAGEVGIGIVLSQQGHTQKLYVNFVIKTAAAGGMGTGKGPKVRESISSNGLSKDSISHTGFGDIVVQVGCGLAK